MKKYLVGWQEKRLAAKGFALKRFSDAYRRQAIELSTAGFLSPADENKVLFIRVYSLLPGEISSHFTWGDSRAEILCLVQLFNLGGKWSSMLMKLMHC